MSKSGQSIDSTIAQRRTGYPALSIIDRVLILGVAVTEFLIGHGRVWARQFDWDRSILWSYATIAALVMIALALRRRLRPLTWLLHTLELVGIKFVLTASFLLGFLITTHPQGSTPAAEVLPKAPPAVEANSRVKPKPEPTRLPQASLGEVQGRVTGGDGTAVPNALIFISNGLGQLVFEPPAQPVILKNDGKRFSPSVSVLQTGQPLVILSANHELHTLQMMKHDHSWVLNVPILASGDGRRLEFDEAKGLVTVECKVHQTREGQAYLAILSHPFHAFTDAAGRFVLRNVPAGELTLSVFEPTKGQTAAAVSLDGGTKVEVALQFGRR
jgi:hypothetical protein